ncbi:MAG: flagellar hook-basal body complex protein [Planctomycetia bacterium]|nr:flagellar hook-basal body complex protein [Planctomycetia bacterium]
MIKFGKTVLSVMTALLCIAAISASTLLVKSRIDQAIDAAAQSRMTALSAPAVLEAADELIAQEPPGRAKTRPGRRDLATIQAIIDEELSDATREEREIWEDELKQRTPQEAREILSLRKKFFPVTSLQRDDDVQFIAGAGETTAPRRLPESSLAPATPISADSLALIDSSIDALQTAEQVILNNIANANTIGFKRSRVLFGDSTYKQMALPGQIDNLGRITSSGLAIGSGTAISATQIDVSQGRLRHTKQALDLAIQGDGYFRVNDGNQFLYTRVGSFTVNANQQIVITSKDCSRTIESAITIPQDTIQISISRDGIVSVLQSGQTQLNQIGNVQLARFINPAGLIARGENLYQESSGSGNPIVSNPGQDGLGAIRQEHLEESNVSADDELAELRRLREQLKMLRKLHAEISGAANAP